MERMQDVMQVNRERKAIEEAIQGPKKMEKKESV